MRYFIPALISLFTIHCPAFSQEESPPSLFSGMQPRCIGPAGVSGRVSCVAVNPANHDEFYIGTATGGLWKTTSSGAGWTPLFDEQNCSSIGAIALHPEIPDVIWVGTGEANPRNSAGVGRGMYKSLDGGKTWKHLGLSETERISRVIVDPGNPSVVYAAALGKTWGENKERGVYKSADGGVTWKQILFVDEKTGAADLAMDPSNPNRLICSMWEHRRWPWFFKSGGPGSGIYSTSDGGETWKKLTEKEGIPDGELGRAGISFCNDHPEVVYILLEAEKSVMLRSGDGGYHFRKVSDQTGINPRPFYFCDIRVHPQDPNTVYRLQTNLDISTDGGKTFISMISWTQIHPDHHALWISPDGKTMIDGNDGGVAVSHDGGTKWRFIHNLALAQFYHVTTDRKRPYNVYGGMQDNGSMVGPSATYISDGIFNDDWEGVSFGDGFATLPDPEIENQGYSMSQGGDLLYYNFRTGITKSIRPGISDVPHRYHWNSALAQDPFENATIYYGSQFVHKSADRGNSWTIISPDLSTNDTSKLKQKESGGLTRDVTAAENHCTIFTISPSGKKQDVIWAGTDDGNIQVTSDGGKTWTNTAPNLVKQHRIPSGASVSHIEASPHDEQTAFVTIDDHRRSNWNVYVFRTTDSGKNWTDTGTDDIEGFCHVIRQDPVDPELLFLGTEFGLYFSTDAGKSWRKWDKQMPTVPVCDMVIQADQHDLVIGTHGRAIWIIDDISPLRNLDQADLDSKLKLLPIQDAYMYNTARWGGSFWSPGENQFIGKTRPYGALINYVLNPPDSVLKKNGTPDAKTIDIFILNQDSAIVKKVKGEMKKGINRVGWNLYRKDFRGPVAEGKEKENHEGSAMQVLPGTYIVKISHQGITEYENVNVFPDPRMKTSAEGLNQRYEFQAKCGSLSEMLGDANERIINAKKDIGWINSIAEARDSSKYTELVKTGKSLMDSLQAIADLIRSPGGKQGIFDNSTSLNNQVYEPMSVASSAFEGPTEAAVKLYERASTEIAKMISRLNRLCTIEIGKFRALATGAGMELIPEYVELQGPGR